MINACFSLLDGDDSGELDQDEIFAVLGDRQLLGQNREEKVKNDIKEYVEKKLKWATKFIRGFTGY